MLGFASAVPNIAAQSGSASEGPSFIEGPPVTVRMNESVSVDLAGYFSDPDALSYSVVFAGYASLPTPPGRTFPWIELDPARSLLRIAPLSRAVGTYRVEIEAENSAGAKTSGNLHIIVPALEAPIEPEEPEPIETPGRVRVPIEKDVPAREHLAKADLHRDFQLRNPNHADVAKSRGLEAKSLVKAWQAGDDSRRVRRSSLVESVRKDESLPVGLRAEVAAMADNAEVEKRRHAGYGARVRDYARTAENLVAEFPSWEIGYESLVGIARSSDPADARRLLSKVRSSEHASEAIKAQASAVEARLSLIGRELRSLVRVKDAASLEKLPGRTPVVLYSWSAVAPFSMERAVLIASRLDSKTAFLGVCLDKADPEGSRQAAEKARLPGVQLYDDSAGSLSTALHLGSPGMGYLLDGQGKIAAVSLAADIMAALGMIDSL